MSLLKNPLFVVALLTLTLAALIHKDAPPPMVTENKAPASMPVAEAPASTTVSIPVVIAPKRAAVSETLAITGVVVHPRTLSVADLERFPPHQIAEVEMICESGAHLGKRENLRGVQLRDILEQAQFKAPTPKHFRQMAIIARATDDYIAVFSWAGIFNSAVGDQVIVYFQQERTAAQRRRGPHRAHLDHRHSHRTAPCALAERDRGQAARPLRGRG